MPKKRGRFMLVTGGAGFIGSHIVEALVLRGDRVRVLDNFSTGKMGNLEALGNGSLVPGTDFEVMYGDIRNYRDVEKAVSGVEGIFHEAALGSVPRSIEDPLTTQFVNADGTLNVFTAARNAGIRRVVYASSSSVYGDSEALPKREGGEGKPLSPYALTKKVNEEFAGLFWDLYGLETIGLRYFNVYGPRQDPEGEYAAVIPRFFSALLSGKRPIIYGTGKQSRDFTYVRDVAEANILAMDAAPDACGAAFNIGRGDRTTVLDLLDVIQDLLDIRTEPLFESARPGDVKHSSADTSSARKMLKFSATSDLKTGLGESLEWYRANLKTP
ncbi:MAG: SDR family oxidoreductase [Desulfomonilaceae bacterium]|nr:SDR family oxidoreductase [Desulfomonilaceae bacterium]